jgi:hypothetical protein
MDMSQPMNKYTNSQWDREIGWGKCPDEYRYKPPSKVNMLHEYAARVNYDVWEDLIQGSIRHTGEDEE